VHAGLRLAQARIVSQIRVAAGLGELKAIAELAASALEVLDVQIQIAAVLSQQGDRADSPQLDDTVDGTIIAGACDPYFAGQVLYDPQEAQSERPMDGIIAAGS